MRRRPRVWIGCGPIGCSIPLLAALAAVLVLVLAACGGSRPNVSACKSAMKAEFAAAVASGKQGTEPPACKGLSDAELRKLAGQVLTGS
jgi:hypothetical protein